MSNTDLKEMFEISGAALKWESQTHKAFFYRKVILQLLKFKMLPNLILTILYLSTLIRTNIRYSLRGIHHFGWLNSLWTPCKPVCYPVLMCLGSWKSWASCPLTGHIQLMAWTSTAMVKKLPTSVVCAGLFFYKLAWKILMFRHQKGLEVSVLNCHNLGFSALYPLGWHPELLRGVVLRAGRSLLPRLSSAASEFLDGKGIV